MNTRQINLGLYIALFPEAVTAGSLYDRLPLECKLDELTFIADLLVLELNDVISFDGAYVNKSLA